MRWMLAFALVGGCKGDQPKPVDKEPAPALAPRADGAVAKRGTIAQQPVAFFGVIAPAGTDPAKLLKFAHATAKAEALADATIKSLTPAEVGWSREHAALFGKGFPAGDVDAIDHATLALSLSDDGSPTIGAQLGHVAIFIANECHGWIMDIDALQIYTPDKLEPHLPGKDVDVHKAVFVHGVMGDDQLAFLDTVGMRRLGLPELFVADVPQSYVNEITEDLNAAAQTLIEQRDLPRDGVLEVDVSKLKRGAWALDEMKQYGGTGKMTWQVKWTRGDAAPDDKLAPEEMELALSIAGSKPGSAEALLAANAAYSGTKPDHARSLDQYRDELRAAGGEARVALTKLRPHFKGGVPPGEQLGVKAPFTTDGGGIEWMWVDVVSFKGEVLDGILDNDPDDVTALKAGARVKVKLGDLADFIYRHDGKVDGGYSLAVLRKHGEDVPPL